MHTLTHTHTRLANLLPKKYKLSLYILYMYSSAPNIWCIHIARLWLELHSSPDYHVHVYTNTETMLTSCVFDRYALAPDPNVSHPHYVSNDTRWVCSPTTPFGNRTQGTHYKKLHHNKKNGESKKKEKRRKENNWWRLVATTVAICKCTVYVVR